jgi:hypothetical protein
MTKLKLLSAGLTAVTLLATPAMARESHVATRQVAEGAYASVAPNANGRVCIPAPRVGAFATAPWTNDTPCEPASGY